MFFGKYTFWAIILFMIIIVFSFYSEYYASKFHNLRTKMLSNSIQETFVDGDDVVPTCSGSSAPTCSSIVNENDDLLYSYNLVDDDKYMLKTEMVPPVCPACPSVINNHMHDGEISGNEYTPETIATNIEETNITNVTNNETKIEQSQTQTSSNVTQQVMPTQENAPAAPTNSPTQANEQMTTQNDAEIEALKQEIIRLKQLGSTSGKDECPPCPPCDRCPEPIFTCEKTINYRSPNVGEYLPIPVLNDFSTFDNAK